MLWLIRAGVIIGGAVVMGGMLSGCSRRREEERPNNATSSPTSTPVVPSVFTPSGPSAPSSTSPSISIPTMSREECNRRFVFDNQASRTPIRNPAIELQNIQSSLDQIETHTTDLRSGNYSAFASDTELNRRITPLELRDVYLREGMTNFVDTESDIQNLYSARDWLIRLREAPTYYPNSPNSQTMANLWANHQLLVGFQGFLFRDNEVPHLNGTLGVDGDPLRFRLITPQNFGQFSVLTGCGIPASQFHIWQNSGSAPRPTTSSTP